MATLLSPGINVSEIDLTTVVPSGATSIGAFAGPFVWGPANEVTLISNETRLVNTFGKPNDNVAPYWFSAANFLAYSNNLKVVRTLATGANNAVSNNTTANLTIANEGVYINTHLSGATTDRGAWAAKYPGQIGNTLRISVCPNANAFSQNLSLAVSTVTAGNVNTSNLTVVTSHAANLALSVSAGDLVSFTDGTTSTAYIEVASVTGNNIVLTTFPDVGLSAASPAFHINRRWRYFGSFTDAPGTSDYATRKGGSKDEMHIAIVDVLGEFSGAANTVVETFGFVSKASDATNFDGTSNYYKNVVNNRSQYIWWLTHLANATNWGNTASTTFAETNPLNDYSRLVGGADGTLTASGLNSPLVTSYNLFANVDSEDVALFVSGPATQTVAAALIGIVGTRKDSVVFLSPEKDDVVENAGDEVTDILAYRNSLTSSSYAVMDSGWKYQYDKYNDGYRWVPLNGDIAGLNARTDLERDPWFSPAGPNRGLIKNVIKLSWNPDQADRDQLYLKGVNPVVTFPGEGTMLYGDKTMQSRPSAFDRINVRRLFIVIEKSISRAARSSLFEFNDQFTRAQFVALIEPYLRDVQGRRGITDFRVVCNDTNNTPEVIDRNEFVGDIYIKPARSINFIQLNFVAVRSGVIFDEIVGQF
jgi:phage tail sheath protein FI